MLRTTPKDKDYPEQLNRLISPLKQLFINSDILKDLLSMPTIAIVGLIRSSTYGAVVCDLLAKKDSKGM